MAPDVLALFDLDHTLLPHDTDEQWTEFLVDKGKLDRARVRRPPTATSLRATTAARRSPRVHRVLPVDAGAVRAATSSASLHAQFMHERIVPAIPQRCARADRQASQPRPPAGADHRHQPLPDRARRARAGLRAPHRHRAGDEGRALHRPRRRHAEHARGQDRAPARMARRTRAQALRLSRELVLQRLAATTCRCCRTSRIRSR